MYVAVDDKEAEVQHVMEDSPRNELPSVLKVIQEARQTQLQQTTTRFQIILSDITNLFLELRSFVMMKTMFVPSMTLMIVVHFLHLLLTLVFPSQQPDGKEKGLEIESTLRRLSLRCGDRVYVGCVDRRYVAEIESTSRRPSPSHGDRPVPVQDVGDRPVPIQEADYERSPMLVTDYKRSHMLEVKYRKFPMQEDDKMTKSFSP